MKKGKIVQISGPVIDVEFEDSDLPYIKDALEVDNDGKRCVMEVAQHIGNNTVRCIMLASSEGLHKDMEVVATGSGIKVPVGEKTLGLLQLGLTAADYAVVAVAVVLVLCVSLKQRRGSIRERLYERTAAVQYLVVFALLFAILIFGAYGIGYDANQFIYNQF